MLQLTDVRDAVERVERCTAKSSRALQCFRALHDRSYYRDAYVRAGGADAACYYVYLMHVHSEQNVTHVGKTRRPEYKVRRYIQDAVVSPKTGKRPVRKWYPNWQLQLWVGPFDVDAARAFRDEWRGHARTPRELLERVLFLCSYYAHDALRLVLPALDACANADHLRTLRDAIAAAQ